MDIKIKLNIPVKSVDALRYQKIQRRKPRMGRKSKRGDCGKIEETAGFSCTYQYKIKIKRKIQNKNYYCCS